MLRRISVSLLLTGLLLLQACNGPRMAMPTVGERRLDLLKALAEKEGYKYTAEELAAMPEGVAVPLVNPDKPGRNVTVEFRRHVLPKGRYRYFMTEYDSVRRTAPLLPPGPVDGQYPESEGAALMEVTTALVTLPLDEFFNGMPDYANKVEVHYGMHVCSLRQRGVHPVATYDEMQANTNTGTIYVPRGVKPVPAAFDARAFPVLNETWMQNGRPVAGAYGWLESVVPGDHGAERASMGPRIPGR